MFIGRPRVFLGLLVLLGATGASSACSGPEEQSRAERADVAVLSYAPPSGAPGYCASLAGSTQLTRIPTAIGTLTARPRDVESKLALAAAADDLRIVGEQVPRNGGTAELGASIDDLLTALTDATDGPVTDSVRSAISTGLDDVGRLVQPVCDFPA